MFKFEEEGFLFSVELFFIGMSCRESVCVKVGEGVFFFRGEV